MPAELRSEDAPFDGRWWSPDDPGRVVGGHLFLDGDVWRVTLLGWLGPWNAHGRDNDVPRLLHGSVRGVPMTLLDLVPGGWRSTGIEMPHDTDIFVNTVLAGMHASDRPRFSWAGARLLHLNEWANRPPWRSTHQEGENTMTFVNPGAVSADLPGATAQLVRDWRRSEKRLSSVTMSSDEWVQFMFDDPCDLAAVEHDWVRPLSGLIELATNRSSPTLELFVVPEGQDWPSRVTVLSAAPRRIPSDLRHHFQFLFTLADLDFGTVMPNWWKITSEIASVSDLIASLRDSRNGYVSQQFLSGASAVEGYHRHRARGVTATPEHKALVKQIVAIAPEQSREWLSARLANSHEPTFSQRIEEVAATAGPLFSTLVGDIDSWRKWVRDGRNSVAHRDPSMVDIDRDWRTTIPITASLRWLMTLVLLKELGLSDSAIEAGVRRERGLESAMFALQEVKPNWFS